MRTFQTVITALSLLLANTVVQAGVIADRSAKPGGSISKPTSGTAITAGQAFDFAYTDLNPCHSGYSNFTVYLVAEEPTGDDVTSSGTLSNFLYNFGNFFVKNFDALPPLDPVQFPPPPATLVAPTLDDQDGNEVFFTVVERFSGCPPDGHTEYGLSTVPVEYN